MNTRLLKGILLYTLVVIGIVLVVGMFFFGIMFFVPSFKPFGIGAIWSRQKEINWSKNGQYIDLVVRNADGPETSISSGASTFYKYKGNLADVYNFEIESKDISVELRANDQEKSARVGLLNNTFGLYKGDYNLKVTHDDIVTKDPATGADVHTIKVVATQPEGWLSVKNSKVVLEVPTKNAYNLKITTRGGDVLINLNNSKSLFVESLDVTTHSGDLKMGNVTQDANFNTNSDYVAFQGPTAKFTHFSAVTDSGNLDFSGIDHLYVDNAKKIPTILEANKGNITFNNLYSVSTVTIQGSNVRLDAKNIYTPEFNCAVTNGYFNVDTIILEKSTVQPDKGYVMISTTNAEVRINNIGKPDSDDNCSAIITTTYGDISISGGITGSAKVSSTHGNIKVNDVKGNVSAQSKYGDINLSYRKSVNVYNDHGSINLTYLPTEIEKSGAGEANPKVTVNSVRGKVNINNQVYDLDVTGQRSAEINVTFLRLFVRGDSDNMTRYTTSHRFISQGSSVINVSIPRREYSANFKYAMQGEYSASDALNQNKMIFNGLSDKFFYEGLVYDTKEPAELYFDARSGRISIGDYDKNSLISEESLRFQILFYTAIDNGSLTQDKHIGDVSYYYDENLKESRSGFTCTEVTYDSRRIKKYSATLIVGNSVATIDENTRYLINIANNTMGLGRFVRDDKGGYSMNSSGQYTNTSQSGSEKYRFEQKNNELFEPNSTNNTIELYVINNIQQGENYGKVMLIISINVVNAINDTNE